MKNKIIKISAVFLSVLILLSSFLVFSVSAAEAVPEDIETSDVISDLKVMGIDYTKYKKDLAADHCRMLKFLEFGFDYGGNQSDYGLYIYVWNPTGKPLNTDSVLNKITMQSRSIANVEQSDWRKLPLEFLDYSTDTGYEHVFYKFRVKKSAAKYLLQNVSRDLRVYEISEIELHHTGNTNANSFKIGGRFTFTGFQPYHNSLRNAVNTLYCSATDRTTIAIDIHPTTWKTDTSAKGIGYANELFSVYFSIPNDIIRDYGNPADKTTKGLIQIDGMYDRHFVNGIVVNDDERYNAIYPHLGTYVPDDSVPFYFFSEETHTNFTDQNGIVSHDIFEYQDSFNVSFEKSGTVISPIYYRPFSSGDRKGIYVSQLTSLLQADISNIKDFISAADFRNALYSIWDDYGELYYENSSNFVNSTGRDFGNDLYYTIVSKDSKGKYIDLADQIEVYSSNHRPTLWQKWFSNSLFEEGDYNNIKSIQVIDSSSYNTDLTILTSGAMSDKYYVSERDIYDLGSYSSKEALYDKTTYLMRFAVEDYYATEVELHGDIYGKAIYFEKVIYQNVDILTFTFENQYSEKVVLPVSATPVDNVGEITPTLKPNGKPTTNTNPPPKNSSFEGVKLIVLILAGVLFIVLLNWLCNLLGFKLSSVFKVIFAIIAWPFKLIGKLFDFIDSRVTSSRKAEEHKWKRDDRKNKSNKDKTE